MTLNELLERSAERWGKRPLLIGEAGGETSYREFLARVRGLAGAFRSLGVGPGDGVAVVLPNVPETLYTWFALARLGAVMLPVNPALPAAAFAGLAAAFPPRVLVGGAEDLERHAGLETPVRVVVGEDGAAGDLRFSELARPAADPETHPVRPWDPCVVLQTSGTTGGCKGVVLSHLSFSWPAREFQRWMETTEEDRFLGCLPLFHLAGEAFAVSAVACGGSLALVDRFHGSRFWDDVRRTGATLVRHLGEMLAVLCSRPEGADERSHGLRAVYGGGARREVAEEFERRFGVPVVEGYGLTETNTVLRNALADRRPGALGRTLPYARVRIADEAGVPMPPGRVGEIQVERNPVMMLGYVGADEGAATPYDRAWFRTGDLGYRDREGWFHFVGRAKNVIRRRGENVFPGDIEEVLRRHPAVVEAAAVGVADRFGGEEIQVYVVLAEGEDATPDQLADWCRGRLAPFQIPRYWKICDELPRTATNKIHRFRLGEMHAPGEAYDLDAPAFPTVAGATGGSGAARGAEGRG